MESLLFSGEVPGQGGYLVSWRDRAPPVAQCRPRLDRLYLHDWFRNRTHVRRPVVERLSWRVIDGAGHCLARHDDAGRGDREQAWLAALDLQLGRGEFYARGQDTLLILITGAVRLRLEPWLRDLLARADHFLDYRLGFQGPDGERLAEDQAPGRGHYAFVEKHEAFLVPV
jgi:hypothetical protein